MSDESKGTRKKKNKQVQNQLIFKYNIVQKEKKKP